MKNGRKCDVDGTFTMTLRFRVKINLQRVFNIRIVVYHGSSTLMLINFYLTIERQAMVAEQHTVSHFVY